MVNPSTFGFSIKKFPVFRYTFITYTVDIYFMSAYLIKINIIQLKLSNIFCRKSILYKFYWCVNDWYYDMLLVNERVRYI